MLRPRLHFDKFGLKLGEMCLELFVTELPQPLFPAVGRCLGIGLLCMLPSRCSFSLPKRQGGMGAPKSG